MRQLFLFLAVISFGLVFSFDTFSQTTSKRKLKKCYEKGKVVYRTKCKGKTVSKTIKVKPTIDEPYGLPNSTYTLPSDGSGQGTGRGQGTGNGYGVGRGTGQGIGAGNGDGSGLGTGSGNNPEKTIPNIRTTDNSGTTPLKILSKPKADYTDEARTNQVQGTVTLKVTFLANGTIGAITPVSGLPNGLTERAVAAAKKIRFEPAKKDGKPISVVKLFKYSFTLF